MIFKDLIPSSKETQCISNDKINLVMLLSEIFVNFSKKRIKHVNTLKRQNANILALIRWDKQKPLMKSDTYYSICKHVILVSSSLGRRYYWWLRLCQNNLRTSWLFGVARVDKFVSASSISLWLLNRTQIWILLGLNLITLLCISQWNK